MKRKKSKGSGSVKEKKGNELRWLKILKAPKADEGLGSFKNCPAIYGLRA